MSDQKPGSPELKEIATKAKELFDSLKKGFSKLIVEVTAKLPKNDPKAPTEGSSSDSKPEVKAEVKPEVKVETKPEVKSEPAPEVKPEPTPEVKPEPKTDAKPVESSEPKKDDEKPQ
ncbi:MAG: hypothetical protein NXI01_04430 [Gammaproteobacteria bacterium]|nr:hypothetical protein [Gammaproteobacteria bacterium]